MRDCLCLSRLLMTTWPPTCSAQSKRWRWPTSDEYPRCLFMEWLSRRQRWSAAADSVVKLEPVVLIICLWDESQASWDEWKILFLSNQWSAAAYILRGCKEKMIRHDQFIYSAIINSADRFTGKTHDYFIIIWTQAGFLSVCLNPDRSFCRPSEQFSPTWRIRRGSTTTFCGSTCRRNWCSKEMDKSLFPGNPLVWTSTSASQRVTRSCYR